MADPSRYRSRPARSHFRLTAASLFDIGHDAVRNFFRNGNDNQAAAIAFYAILSAIPLFILTLWAAGLIFGSSAQLQREIISKIQEFSPYFSDDLVRQLGHIEQKKRILGWVGMLALIWSSSLIFNSIENAFNVTFRVHKTRNYVASKALAIAMIPLGWSVGTASIVMTYIAEFLKKNPLLVKSGLPVGFIDGFVFAYVIPFSLVAVFFTIVYKVTPVGRVSWGSALIGGVLFSVLMESAKHVLTWYLSSNTNYGVIYGSLQTIVLLVIWVSYMALLLLFCAEVVASYRRRSLILLEKAFVQPGKRLSVNERLFSKFGRVYREGDYIFREGDGGDQIFYILIGAVIVEKKAGQVSKVLAEMGPGRYFGEMATFLGQARTASVRAVTDSEIAVIDTGTFRDLLRESNDVAILMLQEFSRRIKQTNESLEGVTRDWIKLIAVLYFMREWPLQDGRDAVSDLAAIASKDPLDIREVLTELAATGILQIGEGRVTGFARERVFDVIGSGRHQDQEHLEFPDRLDRVGT